MKGAEAAAAAAAVPEPSPEFCGAAGGEYPGLRNIQAGRVHQVIIALQFCRTLVLPTMVCRPKPDVIHYVDSPKIGPKKPKDEEKVEKVEEGKT